MGNSASVMMLLNEFPPEEMAGNIAHLQSEYQRMKADNLEEPAIDARILEIVSEKKAGLSKSSSKKEKVQDSSNISSALVTATPERKMSVGRIMKDTASSASRKGKFISQRGRSFGDMRDLEQQQGTPPLMSKKNTALLGSSSAAALPPSRSSNSREAVAPLSPGIPRCALNGFDDADAMITLQDSWDSVTQQPYCSICQMAFKNFAALERHVKYSDLHAKALATVVAGGTGPGSADCGEDVCKPKEGVYPCHLLYFGRKFFWRTKDQIDLSIYHHIAASVLEVIPFDVTRQQELKRLYLKFTVVYQSVLCEVKCKLDRQRTEMAAKDRFFEPTSLPSLANADVHTLMKHKETRIAVTHYVLQRLTTTPALAHDNDCGGGVSHNSAAVGCDGDAIAVGAQHHGKQTEGSDSCEVFFSHCTGDMDVVEGEVALIPSQAIVAFCGGDFQPAAVAHRRLTAHAEIKEQMSLLAQDHVALSEATTRAERVASLVHEAETVLFANIAKPYEHCTRPRRKWVWAIRRVVREARVQATVALLHDKNIAYQPKNPTKSKLYMQLLVDSVILV